MAQLKKSMFFLQSCEPQCKSVISECLRLAILAKRHEPNKLTCKPWEEWLSGRLNNVTYELKQQEELSLNKISTLLTLTLTCSLRLKCGRDPSLRFTVSPAS